VIDYPSASYGVIFNKRRPPFNDACGALTSHRPPDDH
jgi:hypothetical protein